MLLGRTDYNAEVYPADHLNRTYGPIDIYCIVCIGRRVLLHLKHFLIHLFVKTMWLTAGKCSLPHAGVEPSSGFFYALAAKVFDTINSRHVYRLILNRFNMSHFCISTRSMFVGILDRGCYLLFSLVPLQLQFLPYATFCIRYIFMDNFCYFSAVREVVMHWEFRRTSLLVIWPLGYNNKLGICLCA